MVLISRILRSGIVQNLNLQRIIRPFARRSSGVSWYSGTSRSAQRGRMRDQTKPSIRVGDIVVRSKLARSALVVDEPWT